MDYRFRVLSHSVVWNSNHLVNDFSDLVRYHIGGLGTVLWEGGLRKKKTVIIRYSMKRVVVIWV